MKKILIILAGLILALILAVGIYYVFTLQRNPEPAITPGAVFPSGSTSTGGLDTMIYASDGGSLRVRNFVTDESVKPDTANQGYYVLGYQPASDGGTENLPYLIEYISETNYFGISIQKEPLGETRKMAEQYLQKTLGLTEDKMCSLRYQLSVPDSVNSHYAGQNLGFSFCPDAVKLP